MNNLHAVAAMTGMKAPKIRRGGGRHKTPAKPSSPQAHLDNVQSALASGDHAKAKTHALTLAKALHKLTGKASGKEIGPQNPGTPQPLGLASPAQRMPDPTNGY